MSVILATALVLAAQAGPTAADLADAKCVGAMTMLEGQAAAADKAGMQSAMMFFLGKIAGRSGSAAIGPSLQAAIEQIKAAGGEGALVAIAEKCAAEFEQVSGGT